MIEIDLGGGRYAPMEPPESLGAAFATVIAGALRWSDQHRDKINAAWLIAPFDSETVAATYRIDLAIEQAGVTRLAGLPTAPDLATAGPYIGTLRACWSDVAAIVATAVLARDLGLITEPDFARVTAWWVDYGLPVPAPRFGARFAADRGEINRNAHRLRHAAGIVPGWPIGAVA